MPLNRAPLVLELDTEAHKGDGMREGQSALGAAGIVYSYLTSP